MRSAYQKALRRASVGGWGFEGIGHLSPRRDPGWSREQCRRALVEGRVRGHDLFERGPPSGQTVPLALLEVGLVGPGLGPRSGLPRPPGGVVPITEDPGPPSLGLLPQHPAAPAQSPAPPLPPLHLLPLPLP